MTERHETLQNEPPPAVADSWNRSFARSLDQQRSRAHALLQSERERIRRIDSKLTDLIQELAGELLATESRLEQLEQEMGGRATEIEQLRTQLKTCERTCDPPAASEERFAAAQQAVAESQTEQEELRRQLERTNKQLNLRAQELNELRTQLAEVTTKQSDPTALAAATTSELVELRAQRQDLAEQLADAETRLKRAAQIDTTDIDNLRRRFETAVQEVRDLKARNTKLEHQLVRSPRTDASTTPAASNGMDWESQKQRLLAKLEADFHGDDPAQTQDRLTIESTVCITNQVVAEKEAEIRDLKQLLEQQAGSIGDMAVGAASIANILDRDELVCQERAHLKQLEEEWGERLRKAEVDISMERAKLARERSQLQERLQTFETERAQFAPESPTDAAGKKALTKKGTGRWLARLGLKDDP